MLRRVLDNPYLNVVLIVAVGLIAYSNTFDAPFQWDKSYILKNPAVRDLSYFLDLSKAKDYEHYDALRSRYVGYLTFALNYRLHGFEVTGYHVANLLIHVLNALLLWRLAMLFFRTPLLLGSRLAGRSGFIGLLTALIFVSHPVQTEAVTYIFQRLAALATLFYLFSIFCYVKWRLAENLKSRIPNFKFYFVSLASAVLAMKSKENALTLPAAAAACEFIFFQGETRRRLLYLCPLFFTMIIIPLTGTVEPAEEMAGIFAFISGEDASRYSYFITQMRAAVTYTRLLFVPLNQNLDYDYPLYDSFFEPEVLLSFIFLTAVFLFALYLLSRSKMAAELRVIAFGIFWFFMALSVESSIIPLPMLVDEYRLYLPSAGAFISVTSGVALLIERMKGSALKEAVFPATILIPLVFTYATYSRNNVWRNEVSLWEDVVKKSPMKARGHYNLALAYNTYGRTDKAIEQLEIAASLMPDEPRIFNNLGLTYRAAGRTEAAIRSFERAVGLKPDMAEAHFNLALIYLETEYPGAALREFETTLGIDPGHPGARRFLEYLTGREGGGDGDLNN